MESNELNLDGVLKKVLYQNQENNYAIAVLNDGTKICGTYFDTDLKKLEGESLSLIGRWEMHKKYGKQFVFSKLTIKEAELYFFLTKIVKGVSKKIASSLLEKYTDDELCDILDNTPSLLLDIPGIKEKKLTSIVTSWNKFKHLREIGSFLGQYGISSALINKIYQEFGHMEKLIDSINNNPYILTKIKGIGFKRADEIAKSLGIDKFSSFRISACMEYVLKDYCDNNGNSSISKEKLFKLCDDNLHFNDNNILYEEVLIDTLAQNNIHQTTSNRYSPSMLYKCETFIIDFFEKRKRKPAEKIIVPNFDDYIISKEKTLGFNLSKEQTKAVELINNGANVVLLVGYAGTGKSTSSRAILELLEEKISYIDIKCMALSGIASQRIGDTTGYNSATIQSELTKIQNSQDQYFDYKAILIDEASMINSVTFYQILSRVDPDCIVIIVGDDGQLPAIGAGDILADAIKLELAPICKLTKIYRQNHLQAIATIANEIRKGKIPNYLDTFEDFRFVDVSDEDNQIILNSILNIAREHMNHISTLIKDKQISQALINFQVISPMKNGVLGVENINHNLQMLFNNKTIKAYNGKLYSYKLGDKVMHTKNENMQTLSMAQYKQNGTKPITKRIFNGQLGLIIKIDTALEKLLVLYPNDDTVVFYDFNEIDHLLSLAYCLTIHKTQGMEYDTALIPITASHYIMHNTKLLYTAITRAKKMCYIVGEKIAFQNACQKLAVTQRQTVIQDMSN